MTSQRLHGRVALVSGGLLGIGRSIAERFLAEGAQVVIGDLKAAGGAQAQIEQWGAAAHYLQLDVTQEDAWAAAAQQVRGRFERLDVLVNNAGATGVGAVESMTYESWRKTMAVNIDGVFLGTKHCAPLLSETGKQTPAGSSIINISSIMGLVGYPESSAYNASKGAVRLFTKATAIEFALKQMAIRVNSIHPGFVRTPLLEAGMQAAADQGAGASAESLITQLDAATPMGRVARPEEIAGAAYFLASDDSSYCTGSELVVDGGWTAR